MRKQRGRKVISAMLVCALAVGMVNLAGCQKKEAESPTEITLMHGWGGTLKTHNTMQQIYNNFSKENPDIILKCTPYSDSSIAVEKANDMLAVGKMPDVISTNGLSYYVYNAVKRDMAMDLMPYIKEDKGFADTIYPSVLDAWTTGQGQIYTIPDALEVAGYWYNEAYLKAAQMVGADGKVRLPATWTEFFDMVEQLKEWGEKSNEASSVCALEPIQISEYLFQARLAGMESGGDAGAEGIPVENDPDTISRVLEDINQLCLKSQSVDNIETARQNFSDGKSMIYFNGVWESDALSDSSRAEQFRYAAYPTDSGESLAYVSPSSGYVLAKQTDEKKAEASIRFLKYMLSEKVQTEIAVKTGQAPSNPNIDRAQVKKDNPLFGNAINVAYEADIQIKTIWSAWPEERLEVVKQFCAAARTSWNENMGKEMSRQLNEIQ